MNQKKAITSLSLLLLGLGGLHAQENTTAGGGEATGSSGTVSYSIGQVVYTTATGTNGSIAQGVQQPYEISTTAGIEETTIHLEMNVFPNPTTNFLSLKVEDENMENLSYQLVDASGKLIKNEIVANSISTIQMEELPIASYFLNITKNNQIIKTFKIIKN